MMLVMVDDSVGTAIRETYQGKQRSAKYGLQDCPIQFVGAVHRELLSSELRHCPGFSLKKCR
jgi:hypothetical protein